MFGRKPSSAAWLLVGLGNPGDEYRLHRHNIGFMAADAIAERHGFPAWRVKYEGLLAEGLIGDAKVVLLKPQTYMNLSGQSVQAAARFYKIPPERVVVFHDELDLPPGTMRAKQGGGNAGHNGLKSIDAHLGTADYWRVRLGIGHPGDRERVTGHVLGNFAKADVAWVGKLLDAVAAQAPLIVAGEMNGFASKVAQAGPAA